LGLEGSSGPEGDLLWATGVSPKPCEFEVRKSLMKGHPEECMPLFSNQMIGARPAHFKFERGAETIEVDTVVLLKKR
jgi:hypothetical protein